MNETKHDHERSATSTSGTVSPSDVIAFGQLRLRVVERCLERDGVRLKVGSRALDILIALVERAPEVVSKRELLARVWPDLVVDEGSLRFHIAALRKVLGDGQSGTRYVTNVAGRGYCFAATILRSGAKPPPAESPTLPGDIAHEFNDILGAILGYGELAQNAASTDDRMRCYVDNILIAGRRAKSLVEHLLATRSNNI
jgi:DNA-binding winged helix-turn-helix (wHTH) protein